MRYMMFMKVDPAVYDRDPAGEIETYTAMGRYNEELTKAGVLLALDGLQPPSAGARIAFGAGGASVVDGPFAEAKEVVGGYWILDVKSHDEAVEWARRVPAREGEAIDLRPIFEVEDYDPAAMEVIGEMEIEPTRQPVPRADA
jgi:hypothetical protein